MPNDITFGYAHALNDLSPSDHWFGSREERDDAVATIRRDQRALADNNRVRIDGLIRLSDGTVHVERGAPALHVQWRPSVLRTEHLRRPCYREQNALVELISGRVAVIDDRNPFSRQQYASWPGGVCLLETRPTGDKREPRESFWVRALPLPDDAEGCHYVVTSRADLAILRSAEPLPR